MLNVLYNNYEIILITHVTTRLVYYFTGSRLYTTSVSRVYYWPYTTISLCGPP